MKSNSLKVWLGVAVTAMVVSGCDCGTKDDPCKDVSAKFDSPADGDTIDSPHDFVVEMLDKNGAGLKVDSSSISSKLDGASAFGQTTDGTNSANKATFSGINLESSCGAATCKNIIHVSVSHDPGGGKAACVATKDISVNVNANNLPPTVSCSFPQDNNPKDGVLNAAELAVGVDVKVDVTTTNDIGGKVDIVDTDNGGAVLGSQNPVATSNFTISLAGAQFTDRQWNLQAKATNKNGMTNATPASCSILIARTPPTCSLTAPIKTAVGPSDDAVSGNSTFELRASGTGSSTATTLQLNLIGAGADGGALDTTGPQSPMNGGITHDFSVPASGTTSYTVQLVGTDAHGNTCMATQTISVDYDPPTVTIVSPTAQGSPYNMYTLPITVQVNDANAEGPTAHVHLVVSSGYQNNLVVPTGSGGMVTDSMGQFVDGAQTLNATATDAVGNTGTTATQMVTISGATGCSIVFNQPTNGSLITGTSVAVSFQTNCPNTAFTSTLNAQAAPGGTTQANGVGDISLTGLTTGMYTLIVSMMGSTGQVSFQVDTNAPQITLPTPTGGRTYALLNTSNAAAVTGGAQATLQYTATIPTGGHADICSNQTPAPTGATPCANGVTGWWTLKTMASSPDPTFTFPEGSYDLILVVVSSSGTAVTSSMPVSFLVDVHPPVLSNITLPQDTNPADSRLNIAELNNNAPRVAFNVDAANASTSLSVVVHDRLGATAYNMASAFNLSAQAITVDLTQNITTTEADYDWAVTVTDLAGNSSTANVGVVRVDKSPPSSCVITQPNAPLLGGPNDANGSVAGFQLGVTVTSSTDAASARLTLNALAPVTISFPAGSGSASGQIDTTQMNGTVAYSLTGTCTDIAGNTTNTMAATTFSVDLDAPSCTITAPVASPPQYGSFTIPTTVTVTGADMAGRTVTVTSTQSGNTQSLTGLPPVASGSTSASLVYPFSGVQSLTVTGSDPAGNLCVANTVSIDINAMGCSISFSAPTPLGSGNSYIGTNPYGVIGHTSNCGAGKTVTLYNSTSSPKGSVLGTGMTDASGNVTINESLGSGGPYVLTLEINNGAGVLNSVDLGNVFVVLTTPAVTSVTPTGGPLFFVAANNINTGICGLTANPAYIPDLAPGAPADYNVVATNITGANGGKLEVLLGGSVVASQNITADPQTITLPVQLAQNGSGTYVVRITDIAGHQITPVNTTASVDVIAPAAPSVTPSIADPRGASVVLTWAPTYDDGSTAASGANSGYDIRWTTDTVTANNHLATCNDYFSSSKANKEMVEPWSASTINRNVTLPPFNNYYISVSAFDEVGNYSTYAPPSGALGPLANLGAADALVNPTGTGSQFFGRILASNGSLNGDALDDLVTASTAANTVYVYFGRAGFGATTGCTAGNCQAIAIPVTANGDSFGTDVAVGDVGDTSAPDLLVGSSAYNGATGRAFLFFGGNNPINTSTFIEFHGDGTAVGIFGRSVQVIPDITGDGIGEVGIVASSGGGLATGRGLLYIWKGRSLANWQALASGGFVPATSADFVIVGPSPVSGVQNQFAAARGGFSTLGDLDGDGTPDFTVPDSKDTVNQLFLFSGKTVSMNSPWTGTTLSAPLTTGASPIPMNALQAMTSGSAGSGTAIGYGTRALGGLNIFGATANDLVVTRPDLGQVFLYSDPVLPIGSPNLTITNANHLGNTVMAAHLDTGASYDLAIGENSSSATNNFWLFYQHGGTFDTGTGSFYQSTVIGPVSATNGGFGTSSAVGDFDGDGKTDVAISDPATGVGQVIVWH